MMCSISRFYSNVSREAYGMIVDANAMVWDENDDRPRLEHVNARILDEVD
jgi:hypothetical protein